jgi:hypothetical protein
MKAQNLTKEHLNIVFKEIVKEEIEFNKKHCIHLSIGQVVSTFDIRDKLWKKWRIHVIKDAEIVRRKIKEWWDSYKWKYEPLPHKMICGIAVHISSPMSYDYCMLESSGNIKKSLITIYDYDKQSMFIKREKK